MNTCWARPGGGFTLARPDGLRLDAGKHLPVDFWRAFNGAFPGVYKVGELLDGHAGTLAATWREGGFTAMFDFPLAWAALDVFCRDASPAKLAAVLTDDARYPDASSLVTLLDNHDLPRLMSVCGGDQQKVEQALRFLFATRGTPSLTWGTEVGMTGAQEPENRASMRFVAHPLRDFIAARQRERATSPALREGATVVLEADARHVLFARVAPDGATVHVRVEDGRVTVTDAPDTPREVLVVRARAHTFEGTGRVVGSGAALGDWDPRRALTLPATVELPVRGVFEFKYLVDGEFEPGPNRVLYVAP